MISAVDRYKTFRMFRGLIKSPSIVYGYDRVDGRMKYHQRRIQRRNHISDTVSFQVADELTADLEFPPSQLDCLGAIIVSRRARSADQLFDMCGCAGAPIVAIARTDLILALAISTAAPPRLWPINSEGAENRCSNAAAASSKSSTLDEKSELAKSPSLFPSPVKSNRKTATPRSASPRATCVAAFAFFEQVKQWAKIANAEGMPAGNSIRPVS